MTITAELIHELKRTVIALELYQAGVEQASSWNDPRHARAKRATLDATKKLAEWRKYPKPWKGCK